MQKALPGADISLRNSGRICSHSFIHKTTCPCAISCCSTVWRSTPLSPLPLHSFTHSPVPCRRDELHTSKLKSMIGAVLSRSTRCYPEKRWVMPCLVDRVRVYSRKCAVFLLYCNPRVTIALSLFRHIHRSPWPQNWAHSTPQKDSGHCSGASNC